ncbi:ABC transporter ATP-binding protein [Lacticaseibacillus paracasei]|uniref:energy-coupling factor ABC transporter ATP-binding protein n=1 Tax=Lacticaseibacillus paracasei TaxID=1597 RepID=UPI000FF68C90|nr:ABC transporter ATP-binding protein [Lacticaseibacillus paracasei]RWZ61976.1 ABC transporter ATP-binding protein [Lacticaseibacillus paracasei]
MVNNVVEVNNLSFRYRQAEFDSVSHLTFSVQRGSFCCIIGENGAGKSTICNALVGLIPHYFLGLMSGSIHINKLSVTEHSIAELSQQIGLVFQNPFNQLSYTATTVAEELAYGLGNRGVPQSEMVEKVQQIAKVMHIEEVLDQNPLELSGGQAQRVAFGSTFILEPQILVLDECTTQLDPLGADGIFKIVKKLNKQGVTVIMVDHDMERVAQYADHVLVLKNGQKKLEGSPREVFSDERLTTFGVEAPDYAVLSRQMVKAHYPISRIAITEKEAAKDVREALHHED